MEDTIMNRRLVGYCVSYNDRSDVTVQATAHTPTHVFQSTLQPIPDPSPIRWQDREESLVKKSARDQKKSTERLVKKSAWRSREDLSPSTTSIVPCSMFFITIFLDLPVGAQLPYMRLFWAIKGRTHNVTRDRLTGRPSSTLRFVHTWAFPSPDQYNLQWM